MPIPDGMEKLVEYIGTLSKAKPPRMRGDYYSFRVFIDTEKEPQSVVLHRMTGGEYLFEAVIVFTDGETIRSQAAFGRNAVDRLKCFLMPYQRRLGI